jgi:hypothetical protein
LELLEVKENLLGEEVYQIKSTWINYIDEVSNKLWMQAAGGVNIFQMTRNQIDKLLNLIQIK